MTHIHIRNRPGPIVEAPPGGGTLFRDSFADVVVDTQLEGRTANDPSETWQWQGTVHDGTGTMLVTEMNIAAANQAYGLATRAVTDTNVAVNWACPDLGSIDMFCEATFNRDGSNAEGLGPCVRVGPAGNANSIFYILVARSNRSHVRLWDSVNAFSTLVQFTPKTGQMQNGEKYRIRAEGSTIRIEDVDDPNNYFAEYTAPALGQIGTRAGLGYFRGTNNGASEWQDVRMGLISEI